MSRNMERLLLEEASEAAHRKIGKKDKLYQEFNINRYFTFMQNVYRRHDVELSVNSSFYYKTIPELADAVESNVQNKVPKLLTLQDGDGSNPLIVFAGGASCFLALKSLIAGLEYEGVIYGMCATDFERPKSNPATVADEIESCCAALTEQGIRGPFNLIGYSIGGIFALELARRLRETGGEIRFLALIDTLHNEHTWPWPVWFRHLLNRMAHKLRGVGARFLAKRRQEVGGQGPQVLQSQRRPISRRLKRYFFRYCDPTSSFYPELAPEWCDSHTPAYKRVGGQLLRMRGLYRPHCYHGELVFYRATSGHELRCDARQIWSRYLPEAEWVDTRGDHLSMVVGRNGAVLGRDIGRRLRSCCPEEVRIRHAALAP